MAWREVRSVELTGSTNADVVALAARGEPEGLVLSAGAQSTGRGRLARPWASPPGTSISVSVLLRPAVPPARWTWLPLLAGVAVCDAVRSVGVDAALKWPNDVLVGDGKLGGILVERVEPSGLLGAAAVVGIGLNVTADHDDLPAGAVSVQWSGGGAVSLDETLSLVLSALESRYRAWVAADGDASAGLRVDYVERCSTIGHRVRVEMPGRPAFVGEAEDIDASGRLVVHSEGSRLAVGAGDVVHVRRQA